MQSVGLCESKLRYLEALVRKFIGGQCIYDSILQRLCFREVVLSKE